jgi:hypothetical protein
MMDVYRQQFNFADVCRHADRYNTTAIKRLQSRFSDPSIDIRRITVDGKPFWSIIRWRHPKLVLGKNYQPNLGIQDLAMVVYRWADANGNPRELTDGDLHRMMYLPEDAASRSIAASQREQQEAEKTLAREADAYAREVAPHLTPKSYQTHWMVDENERRIAAGEA